MIFKKKRKIKNYIFIIRYYSSLYISVVYLFIHYFRCCRRRVVHLKFKYLCCPFGYYSITLYLLLSISFCWKKLSSFPPHFQCTSISMFWHFSFKILPHYSKKKKFKTINRNVILKTILIRTPPFCIGVPNYTANCYELLVCYTILSSCYIIVVTYVCFASSSLIRNNKKKECERELYLYIHVISRCIDKIYIWRE